MSEYPKVLVKDKQTRTAHNAAQVVQFEFEGFKVPDKRLKPAVAAPAEKPVTAK